jgi:hypothetical protein
MLMHKFIVREIVDGILVTLAVLLERLSFAQVSFWVFTNVRLHSGHPLGYSVVEFERMSAEPGGIPVPCSAISQVTAPDFQMIDGEIEGYAQGVNTKPLLRIECFDASQWEVTTDFSELAAELERRGFLRK